MICDVWLKEETVQLSINTLYSASQLGKDRKNNERFHASTGVTFVRDAGAWGRDFTERKAL